MGQRALLAVLAAVLVGSGGAAASAQPLAGTTAEQTTAAPIAARARAQLRLFTDWLADGDAKGFVGEVGWPGNPEAGGDARWNAVSRDWYRAADAAGLWVAAWATGEIWASSYKLLVYRAPTQYSPVAVANPQAAVVESQPRARLRGVNVDQGAFGEFGSGYHPIAPTSPLHNRKVGEYGRVYSYPGRKTYAFLASRGIPFVRLPFRWERVQRTPGGPLDRSEIARLRSSLAAASAAGVRVILDCHNYGAYYLYDGATGRRRPIGSREVPQASFADLWRRLARRLGPQRAVLGYGLMNEPVAMPGGARTWERASAAAVAAIRSTGDRRRIFVGSYHWGGMWQFRHHHRRGPWIRDPARNTWYEAHAYFDADLTARYLRSFDQEAKLAKAGA